MKKIIILLSLFILTFSNIYSFSKEENKIINIFINKVEKISKKKWDSFKKLISKKLKEILKEGKFKKERENIIKRVIFLLDKEDSKKEELREKPRETVKKSDNSSVWQENYLKTKENKNTNFDFKEAKKYWLEITNNARKKEWLWEYKYSHKLEETASEWSKVQKRRWAWSHKRSTNDSFYDYNKINSWFKKRWVSCKNIHRVTFTENVWYRSFSCKNNSCTDNLKNALDKIFAFYMSEKNKKSRPHYNSLMNKYFNYIWVWIELDKKGNNYKCYLTVHYCTEFE